MKINLFGLSGGKDSTALWLWGIHESGYPRETIRGTFADTQNEYDEVYEQVRILDAHGQKHGVPPVRWLHSILPGNQPGGFLNLAIWKKRFPSAKARFCTEWLKIIPCQWYVQELQLEGCEIISHSGVRADESTERSMLPEWGDGGLLNVPQRRPLLKWTIDEVWAIHRRYKIPINPLYFTGRKRVGCRLCCMSNKEDVRIVAKNTPWVIDQYREWEKIVGAKVNDGGFASFFPRRTIPEHLRSIKGMIRKRDARDGKAGDTYSICTIDDVVKWSMTLHGGKQQGFEFMFEQDDAHLPCQSGYCE